MKHEFQVTIRNGLGLLTPRMLGLIAQCLIYLLWMFHSVSLKYMWGKHAVRFALFWTFLEVTICAFIIQK